MSELQIKHSLPSNGRKLNVCAYARVSTDKDLAEMSLKQQIKVYTTLILENPDWEFCGVFADEGITGTSIAKRDSFNRMVDKALHGMIDVILVKSISRFGRNIMDVMIAINQLREHGVEVYFEKENISTLDASSTLALNLYAKLAEQEAVNVSENVQWSVDKRMREGKYRIPVEGMLGYAYLNNGELIIVEEEAKIIREIFDLYINRVSASFIARKMEEKGYKTGIGNTHWTVRSIRTIIINEKYVGDCYLRKSFNPKISATSTVVNRGEKEAYYIKNGHPAIITREVWEAACALREERAQKMGQTKGMQKVPPSVFAGFGICPYCGKNYYVKRLSNAKSGIKKCLACGSNKSILTCHESESVFIDDLLNILNEQLNIILTRPSEFKSELRNAFTFDEEGINKRIQIINERIDFIKTKLLSIESETSEEFKRLKKELDDELNKLILDKGTEQNKLLTCKNADTEISKIYNSLKIVNKNDLKNTFRNLFKHMVVKNRCDITFIIGNEDVSKLNLLALDKCLTGTYQIKVRAQIYQVQFGLFINI